MTQEEFLERLARTPRDWRLMGGRIRRIVADDEPQCPITAVASQLDEEPYSAAGILLAVAELGIHAIAVSDIIAASDDLQRADPLVRMQLLEACGLLVDEKRSLDKEIRGWWLTES